MKRLIVLFGLLIAVYVVSAQKYSFKAEVSGSGNPILMIPGLSSSGDVWNGTVKELSENFECHVVTLPGFAGQPAIENDNYLTSVGDELIQYLEKEKLKNVVIMGHSLGGFLTLYIGTNAPKLVSKLVVVDGLPFLGAMQNPAATPETTKGMAEMMKKNIELQTTEQYEAMQPTMLKTMITADEHIELAMEWGRQSDKATIAKAMYEMYQMDLREKIASISSPTLVLGAWAGYKDYGVTKEMTMNSFRHQYRNLKDVQIALSEEGRHFLMWDDPQFFYSQIRTFLQ
ncbi:MAG: alpha/beta hydrolase [Cyclobacteriaceae bacterium]